MTAFKVTVYNPYGLDDEIDTVFFDSDMTDGEVKKSLVNRDGYRPDIIVTKVE